MSKTQKTWIKQNSKNKKQIKYSFKKKVIDSQLIKIQIFIKNVDNIKKNKEIPSKPKEYIKFQWEIKKKVLENWNKEVLFVKLTQSNKENKKIIEVHKNVINFKELL